MKSLKTITAREPILPGLMPVLFPFHLTGNQTNDRLFLGLGLDLVKNHNGNSRADANDLYQWEIGGDFHTQVDANKFKAEFQKIRA